MCMRQKMMVVQEIPFYPSLMNMSRKAAAQVWGSANPPQHNCITIFKSTFYCSAIYLNAKYHSASATHIIAL